jgi:type IV pilus assembly protein PilE
MATHTSIRGRSSGFTLIELMATVAIVAILASLAYPQYTAYLQRGRIMDATTKLQDFRIKMEQYYQDNRTYQNAGATGCGVADPPSAPTDSFDVKCLPGLATPTSYVIEATGIVAKNMANFTYRLTVDPTGLTKTTVMLPPTGWKYPVPNNCWTTRKDGLCA